MVVTGKVVSESPSLCNEEHIKGETPQNNRFHESQDLYLEV